MVNKNQVLLSKINVICCLIFLREIEGTICAFDVKIEQRLFNEGFHRNLSIYIDFTSHYGDDFLYEDCMVGIEQTLPAGVYSSPEDINDNRCKSLIHPIFKTPVNIELPAKKAEPIVIHLLSKVKDARTHIYIPVHARYHHAVSGGGIVRNKIPAPMLYLMCPEKRLEYCENLYDEISDDNNFCSRELARELCAWKEIPAKIVTAPLSWEVPVGNTDHYPLVACGTVVVVVAGSLYLLNTLHKHHARLRTKNKSALSQYLCVSLISKLT